MTLITHEVLRLPATQAPIEYIGVSALTLDEHRFETDGRPLSDEELGIPFHHSADASRWYGSAVLVESEQPLVMPNGSPEDQLPLDKPLSITGH